MNVTQAVSCAINGFAVATIASSVAAATSTSTAAMIANTIFAVSFAGLTVASITAALDERSTDASKYFETIFDHVQNTITALIIRIANVMNNGVLKSVIEGIGAGIYNGIFGVQVRIFEIVL